MKIKNVKLFVAVFAVMLTIALGSISVHADFGDVTLKYGMRSEDVKILQTKLKTLGYFSATATGYFGSITKASVISFQKSRGLVADGIVGPYTFKALNAAFSATASRGSVDRTSKAQAIIDTAKQYLGVPYVWGGSSPNGFDCSGFVYYVYSKNGITIPRVAKDQYTAGTSVSKSSLIPGDLVFFTTYAPGASHVGIYLGGGQFIHASSGQGKVIISSLSSTYYTERYVGARRVF